MIGAQQMMIGILAGGALMVFGLVPGLFEDLVNGVRNFSSALQSRSASPRPRKEMPQPYWLARIGSALILFTILAYLSD